MSAAVLPATEKADDAAGDTVVHVASTSDSPAQFAEPNICSYESLGIFSSDAFAVQATIIIISLNIAVFFFSETGEKSKWMKSCPSPPFAVTSHAAAAELPILPAIATI
jgi:hypothetical protein